MGMRLTRYFIIREIAEKIESIVESGANVLGTRGLEANRGVNPACLAIDVCRHHVICIVLGLSIRIEAYSVKIKRHCRNFFLTAQIAAVSHERIPRYAVNLQHVKIYENRAAYGKRSGPILLQCSGQAHCWKHQSKDRSNLSRALQRTRYPRWPNRSIDVLSP